MEHRKFLVLRLGAVGDVIRTLPAVKALKDYYPASYVAWVVEEPSKALLESQPEIDEVILFPRKRWTDGIRSARRMWRTAVEVRGFVTDLRRREFDTVLDFHGILKSGLISFFSGAPERVGFDRRSSKEFNYLFSNVKVRLQDDKVSRNKRNLSLLGGIGLKPDGYRPSLHIPSKDREYIESFFKGLSISAKSPLIAVHPGTSPKTSYKRWMPNQYSQVADRLVRELGASIIFTWGPEELKWVEGIQEEMKEASILGPKTESLTQLGEVYRRCHLYLGGDTGPMHIASFMGIPAVVIYGPTDPIVNEPLGQYRKVRKEVGCNPCRNRSCKELTCLKAVTVDDVFMAIEEILSVTI
jgi:heptosyltransferase I